MNKVIIDGCVQKDTKLFEEIANFNISSITGEYVCMDNTVKNRFTYFRVIFPHKVTPEMENIIQQGAMIRIYGKLDSEHYHTASNKTVYNKIICADRIVRIKYDKDSNEYVEVE